MAVGSVWDWNRLEYDYFRVPGASNLGGFEQLDGLGLSKKPTAKGMMGIDIEDALPKLPNGSVKVGSGIVAKGRIYRGNNRPSLPSMKGLGHAGLGADSSEPHRHLVSNPFIPALLGASTAFLVSRFVPKDKSVLALLFFFGLTTGLTVGMNHSKWDDA